MLLSCSWNDFNLTLFGSIGRFMDFQTNSHILLNFVFGDNKSFSCLSKGSGKYFSQLTTKLLVTTTKVIVQTDMNAKKKFKF